MRRVRLPVLALLAVALVGRVVWAQSTRSAAETATARRFAAIRNDPALLLPFLRAMPKGGDLHNHLSGSIYAETFVRWSIDDQLCLSSAAMAIVGPPCDPSAGRPPLAAAVQDAETYNRLIDAMSMRNWNGTRSGHEHFFGAFAKFGPASARVGDMLSEVTTRAAAEHVSYVELTIGVDGGAAGRALGATAFDPNLPGMRDRLLAAGFRNQVLAAARARIDGAEARRNELQACGTPHADAGCRVTVRYVQQVLRATPPEQVFAQMLAGFELAQADPRVVSLNPVQPEDDPVAIRDFTLHMRMLEYLTTLYPSVPLTLHAGELTDGLVPPEALRFHIRQSIRLGRAKRIGHGTSIMSEDDPFGLLREMAANRVLVEVALTSSDVILGVRGNRHPLRTYLRYGVPVALVTDDAGLSRSSHTLEFKKAVEEHNIDYPTLKQMVRNSLAYAFVDQDTKAMLQADLEKELGAFEREQGAAARTAR